jgi:hypothetical protein
MTDHERELLHALASMCRQYLPVLHDGSLDHSFMGAGQLAIDILVEYGLMEPTGRGGTWTETGLAVLRDNFRSNYPPDPVPEDFKPKP